jgi:hypothetical protein
MQEIINEYDPEGGKIQTHKGGPFNHYKTLEQKPLNTAVDLKQ